MTPIYEVVDDQDQVIGLKDKATIHRLGLKHREVHVCFITPRREIIFQRRAADKDLFPNLLDATVGGHVERGESYDQAALREAEEETGQRLAVNDLVFFNKKSRSLTDVMILDKSSGKINNAVSARYFYIFRGRPEDLRVELGKAAGFEFWSLDKLDNLRAEERRRFIPYILDFFTLEAKDFINNLFRA